MISRVVCYAAVLGAAVTLGCTGEVVVLAQLESEDGESTVLKQLPVRFLAYDRDVVFDSLKNVFDAPEPSAPDSLAQLQSAIQVAQAEWSTATDRWNSARDSLRALRTALDNMPRSSGQYRLLFRDFTDQEGREGTAKRQMDSAFGHFDDLQKRYTSQAQNYALLLEQWGDEAYADVDMVIDAREEELGRVEVADTTDDNGVVRLPLKKGQWWVYARYELVYEELYWNMRVDVLGGDPAQIILNRANAQRRPRY